MLTIKIEYIIIRRMAEKYPNAVFNFLKELGLEEYYGKFKESGVVQIDDMKVKEEDLIDGIGMTPEEARILLNSLTKKV